VLDAILRDARYAWRSLRRDPGFALIAVVILALGIGANTAVFSVINPLLLRPMPFPDADRLVWIEPDENEGGMSGATYPVAVFEELRRQTRSFDRLSAYFAFFGYDAFKLTGAGHGERLVGVPVAPGFFELLGVQPALGRLFTRQESAPGGPRAVLLTHALWERRFAGDPSIVGRVLTINNEPVTVVGVLPRDFHFSSVFTPGVRVDLFAPADLEQMRPWGNTLAVVGRLKGDVSLDAARAEIAALMPRLNQTHDWGRRSARILGLKQHVSGHLRQSLLVLWAAVGFVLLIVCANLSNLLLARTAGRSKEIAVRMALGAGRGRVATLVLTEGVLLSLAGAALGIPLAILVTSYLAADATSSLPLLSHVRVDGAALAATTLVAIVTGLAFGAIPALRVASRDLHESLKEQSRGSTDGRRQGWLRSALVVGEVALACILLTGAGLLLRSFVALLDVDLGFRPAHAMALHIDPTLDDLPKIDQQTADARRQALLAEVTHRVAAVPGVEAAGLTDALPLDRNRNWNISRPGQEYRHKPSADAFVYIVGPGYVGAMGIPILEGRDFNDHDTGSGAPVGLINQTLARYLYPGRSAIGQLAVSGGNEPFTIVGVVADVRQSSVEEGGTRQMYFPLTQQGSGSLDLVVRSTLPAASLVSGLRATVSALDPTLITSDARPVEDLVERAISPRKFLLTLLGAFSMLALVLACLGIYGVVSYAVSQRGQEIGVRMALGATGRDVRRQVLGSTMRLGAIGVVLGLIGSFAVARAIAALLYGTSPGDPLTFAATAALLVLVVAAGGYVPALRASRIEPMSALRAE
jgi:predicted permease